MEAINAATKYSSHYAWYLLPMWGHVTSANALMAKMLELNEALVITVVHHKLGSAKAKEDLLRYPGLPWNRLNVVEVGETEISGNHFQKIRASFQQSQDGYIQTLKRLVAEGSNSWPAPTALFLDQACTTSTLSLAKEICGPNCKTYGHWTPSTSTLLMLISPSYSDTSGVGDFEDICQGILNDESRRKGRNKDQILENIFTVFNGSDEFSGKLVKIPDIKEMYDYERAAKNAPGPPGIHNVFSEMARLLQTTDGIVTATSDVLEGLAVKALNKISPTIATGIQVSPRGWGKGARIEGDPGITKFLDRFQQNEVLYISFGTMAFPSNTLSHLSAVLAVLIEEQFPFLLGLGGPQAVSALGQPLLDRVQSSGVGAYSTSWVDQQAVLQHPNVGWFLSHGGWNSICESLVQGVPLVIWPLALGDQPTNAALLSLRDQPVAFELMQIRQGAARAEPRRGGDTIIGDDESVQREFRSILKKMRSSEGIALRTNAESLSIKLAKEKVEKENQVIRNLASI